jgi:hypothetical protein
VPRSQRGFVFTCVALLGGDVADAGVPVLDVVPMHEFGRLGPGLVQAGEAFGGELGAVFRRAEQRFGVGVVIADTGSRVRGLHAQPVQHRQHRRGRWSLVVTE